MIFNISNGLVPYRKTIHCERRVKETTMARIASFCRHYTRPLRAVCAPPYPPGGGGLCDTGGKCVERSSLCSPTNSPPLLYAACVSPRRCPTAPVHQTHTVLVFCRRVILRSLPEGLQTRVVFHFGQARQSQWRRCVANGALRVVVGFDRVIRLHGEQSAVCVADVERVLASPPQRHTLLHSAQP